MLKLSGKTANGQNVCSYEIIKGQIPDVREHISKGQHYKLITGMDTNRYWYYAVKVILTGK